MHVTLCATGCLVPSHSVRELKDLIQERYSWSQHGEQVARFTRVTRQNKAIELLAERSFLWEYLMLEYI